MSSVQNIARDVRTFTSNAFLVDGVRTVLVDAGSDFDATGRIEDAVDDLDAVVLTHTHPDHIGTLPSVVESFGVDVWGYDPNHDLVDHAIADGESIRIGDSSYRALHTPGHKNDHICLYSGDSSRLFVGDLVFENGGFGRTDLPEGDRETLVESIEYLLDSLEEVSVMYPGHGPTIDTDPIHHVELAAEAARMGR